MTAHGRVDCYINPADSSLGRRNEEIFGNICDFLTGSLCNSLGISLVACSWQGGTGGAGHGLGFWDGSGTNNLPTTPNGNGPSRFTWAVFRWANAPRGQFDMMFLIASGSGQSLSPFNVSTNTGTVFGANNSFGIVGWSAAAHPSGSTSHPWAGGSGSVGADSLGAQIWGLSSASNGGFLPRANNPADGTAGATRNYMVEMHDDGQFSIPMRMHIICTEGSFTCLQDYGLLNDYRIFHFGSYAPRPGMLAEAPYFMIAGRTAPQTNNIVQVYNAFTYGGTGGTNFGNGGDGGVMMPTLVSGSRNVALTTIGGQNVDGNIGSFNFWVNSGSYDLLPCYVCAQDAGGQFNGILGTADYIQGFGFGMVGGTVNIASSTVAFGQAASNTLKLIFPWSGSSPGSLNGVRTGREF